MASVGDAFVAAVTAAAGGRKVYDSIVTVAASALPSQYVLVAPDPGEVTDGDAVCGFRDGVFRAQVTVVCAGAGFLGRECRDIASMIRDGLLGSTLSAPGWACGPIQGDFANPPVDDESVLERPTVYVVMGFRVQADRQ